MRALKIIIFAVIAVAIGTSVFFWFSQNRNNESAEVVSVEKEPVLQEIFATGEVKPAQELRLSFQAGGLISDIFVKEGNDVKRGQLLAELDAAELESQLREAEAQLSAQESSFKASQVQLQNAKDTLFTRIRDSYNKIDEAFFTDAEPLFAGGSFGLSVQEGATIYSFNTPDLNLRFSLNEQRKELLYLIPQWKKPVSKEEIVKEANLARERLEKVRDFIDDLAEAVSYFSTDKTTVATTLNTHRSAVSGAQSSISLAIVNLDSAIQNLMAEESKVSEAPVEQAKRQIETLQIELRQTQLFAPASGTILETQAKKGEVVQSGEAIFTFYPEDPLRVEAEVYEGDIGGVFVGQKARIEFVAYPGRTFEGQVLEIKPAPLLIDGVVHYLAILQIIEPPSQILSGMSADVRFSPE